MSNLRANGRKFMDRFLSSTAVLIGDVVLDEGASVWFGAVLRGDPGIIRIGKESNVQDNVVIHADTSTVPLSGIVSP